MNPVHLVVELQKKKNDVSELLITCDKWKAAGHVRSRVKVRVIFGKVRGLHLPRDNGSTTVLHDYCRSRPIKRSDITLK